MMDGFGCADLDGQGNRKSERERRKKRSFSPDLDQAPVKVAGQVVKKKKKATSGSAFAPDRPFDRLPNGMPFRCDLCKSSYVCNPLMSKRASRVKRSKHMPSPRYKTDHSTGKTLMLCNACGIALDRPKKPKKVKPLPSQDEKDKYMLEAKLFASSLAADIQIPEAEILYCPTFKITPCRCLQEYLTENGKEDMQKRAEELTELHKDAKRLSALKFYDVDKLSEAGRKGKRARNIGLGNGQKKSAAYEMFVLEKRQLLRNDKSLCERATQKILRYSNNFLHKKLKTEERGCRAQRVKGKAALGLLRPLEQLHKDKCCIDNCVRMALSHRRLLEQWRDRATSGQQEARRVLAEMLTPSGGVRSNCYKFITWVTGCSASTIGKVNDQMKQTGGEREPPQHGLRKYWMNNPRRASSDTLSQIQSDNVTIASTVNSPSATPECSQTVADVTSTPPVQTSQANTEGQQQMFQHQTQLLKVLEQKLMQTQMMQQTLMQQIARPDVAQNLASVQGMLSQLSQMQAAAAAQSPSFQTGLTLASATHTPQVSTQNPISPNHTQSVSHSAQHPVNPTYTYTVSHTGHNPLNPTPPQTVSHSAAGQASVPFSIQSQTKNPVQLMTAGHTGQQVNIQNQQQFNNMTVPPQFPTVQIPVLNNPQSNILHLQSPNIQIKLAQPQYVLQQSPTKAATISSTIQSDHQYVAARQPAEKTKNVNIEPARTSGGSDTHTAQVSDPNVLRTITREETVQRQNVRTEPVSLVKIGNQIHQIVNICPQTTSPMVAQPVQLQNIRPTVGLRVPIIQPNQIHPPTQNQQEPFYTQDSSRHQIPQFLTLAPLNSEQLQQKGVQNVCVPTRLPVGSPITVQQLQQMVMQSQRMQQETSVHHQKPITNIPTPLPSVSKVQATTHSQASSASVKEHDAVVPQIPQVQVSGTKVSSGEVESTPKLARSATEEKLHIVSTATSHAASQSSSIDTSPGIEPSHDSVAFSPQVSNTSCTFSDIHQGDPTDNKNKSSPLILNMPDSGEDSSRLNFNDLENHALGELAQLNNVGQGHDPATVQTGQGSQQGMNCALLVHPIQNTNSDAISSGHQTPSNEVDEMLRSFYINRHGDLDLVSPLTLPDNLTRSRNNSGESTIEPTISVDVASFPRELLSFFTQQGVTITISNGQSHQSGQ